MHSKATKGTATREASVVYMDKDTGILQHTGHVPKTQENQRQEFVSGEQLRNV